MRNARSILICSYRHCAIALALFAIWGGGAHAENGDFGAAQAWRAVPLTEGSWRYQNIDNAATALFSRSDNTPIIAISCDLTRRDIWITRALSQPSQTALPSDMLMHITTDTSSVILIAHRELKPFQGTSARLDPMDSLLDSIAFSVGRFAVEMPDQDALYLPAWAEIARVIEDCR